MMKEGLESLLDSFPHLLSGPDIGVVILFLRLQTICNLDNRELRRSYSSGILYNHLPI